MKKLAYIGLVAAIAALTTISCNKTDKTNLPTTSQTKTVAVIDTTPDPGNMCDSLTVNLLAGQYINVGTVTVANDAETLFVTYTITGDWIIGEIHLYVGTEEEVPANKKGNPQVGHFPTQEYFDPMVTTVTYEFPLSGLGDCFMVAAHAVVYKVVDGQTIDKQTAWGEGARFVDKGNWATYFEYCPGICQ